MNSHKPFSLELTRWTPKVSHPILLLTANSSSAVGRRQKDRRLLHKLWALGERSDLRFVEEQWLLPSDRRQLAVLEHPGDALLVHFCELNGRLHAVTRAGPTPAAARVEEYIAAQRIDYVGFAHCAISAGLPRK